MIAAFEASDWPSIRLVVFDLDGTLYEQRPVRLAMAAGLLGHVARTGRFGDARVLAQFRRLRERLGDEALEAFEPELYARAAAATGRDRPALQALAEDWLERRPLRHLRSARVPGAAELFAALRRSGRRIGVWSDHPVVDKLAALSLAADHAVAANDRDIGCLKPLPLGLETIMERAGVAPAATLMIGDRPERDGEAARRAGARFLLRRGRRRDGLSGFRRYDDPIFAPVLAA